MTEEEFLKAYNSYADAIFRHCFFRVFERELARDLVQETFIRTWEYAEHGAHIDNVRAFLYRVATNLIIDHSRRKKELSLDALKEQGFDAVTEDGQTVDFVELGTVLEAIGRLPEKYRQMVTLRYIEDLPPEEISKITGKSANAVSVRIHRGIEKLRKILDK